LIFIIRLFSLLIFHDISFHYFIIFVFAFRRFLTPHYLYIRPCYSALLRRR